MIVAFVDLATECIRKWVDVMPENIQNQERLPSEIIVAIDLGPDLYKDRFTEKLVRAPDLDYLIPGEEIMYRGSVTPVRSMLSVAAGNLSTTYEITRNRVSTFAGIGAFSTTATGGRFLAITSFAAIGGFSTAGTISDGSP